MTRTINIKKFLGIGLFVGLFVFIIGYSLFQTKAIAKGVDLSIDNITDGQVFRSDAISLSGTAIHATHLSVNDKEIVVDENNAFSEELVLSAGYNIITIEASDKFNKQTVKTYRVLYDAPEPTTGEDVATLPDNQ